MAKTQPNSIGEVISMASNQLRIDARNQSYAVATEIVKNVTTRFGSHEAPAVILYWTALSDGFYAKIKSDMDKIVSDD